MKTTDKVLINGLTERHVAQIIRRKMIQKAVPCVIDSLLVLSGMFFVFTVVGYVVGMFLTLL